MRKHLRIRYMEQGGLVRVEVLVSATPRTALVLDDSINAQDCLGDRGKYGTPLRGSIDDLYPLSMTYRGQNLTRVVSRQ